MKEFRKRVNDHAAKDHIAQGTYGLGSTNGKTEFQGCWIGCSAIPSAPKALKAFIKEYGWEGKDIEGNDIWQLDIDGGQLLPLLEDEFGISNLLARTLEAFFESQPTHGDAINFLPASAKAMNEGADITDEDIVGFLRGAGLDDAAYYDDFDDEWVVSWEPMRDSFAEATVEFLDWLGEQK